MLSQDQTFSTTRDTCYPRHGASPGCASPLEFEAMLMDRLKDMNVGMEMMWQLANFDFAKWLEGCAAASFSHY
eukprot:2698532-Pleurochrysis_carterae.AAC.1